MGFQLQYLVLKKDRTAAIVHPYIQHYGQETAVPDNQKATMVNSKTLSQWLHEGKAILIDVRERHEFAQERIPGSTLHPLSEFDASNVPRDGEKHLVFHCAAGVRCGKAAEIIRLKGLHGPVHRLDGGLKAWKENGGLTEPGNN